MNLAMLSTLQAIIEQGSFAAAAERVGCTPSAVSLQIKQLESHFGRPLFDRSSRAVKPTPLALDIAGVAKEYTARLDALRARPMMAVSGVVRFGAITSMQTDVMPGIVQRLAAEHPGLELRISPVNDTEDLLAELKADRLDAAMIVRPAAGGARRLLWTDLGRQKYVMLAPADAGASRPEALLRTLNWIAYDTLLSGGRTAAQYVRRIAPAARRSMELRSMDAIVSMVSLGLGISVLPKPRQALLDAYPVKVISLGANAPSRQIALARREADADNRNLDAVLKCARGVFESWPR